MPSQGLCDCGSGGCEVCAPEQRPQCCCSHVATPYGMRAQTVRLGMRCRTALWLRNKLEDRDAQRVPLRCCTATGLHQCGCGTDVLLGKGCCGGECPPVGVDFRSVVPKGNDDAKVRFFAERRGVRRPSSLFVSPTDVLRCPLLSCVSGVNQCENMMRSLLNRRVSSHASRAVMTRLMVMAMVRVPGWMCWPKMSVMHSTLLCSGTR